MQLFKLYEPDLPLESRRMFIRALVAAVLFASSAAQSAETPRQPTSKWVADFAENRCLLSRDYGSKDKPFVLSFEQFPTDDGIEIHVFKSGSRQDLNNGHAVVRFGIAEPVDVRFGAHITTGNLRRIQIPMSDKSYLAATTSESVSISADGEFEATFALPGFSRALDVLRKCVIDLGEHWGISAEDQLHIAKSAKSVQPLGSYFSVADYPREALRQDAAGRTDVRLAIDANGKPTDCTVMKPSGNKALDSATCGVLLRRARFHPAIDTDGKSVKSVIVAGVNWLIL